MFTKEKGRGLQIGALQTLLSMGRDRKGTTHCLLPHGKKIGAPNYERDVAFCQLEGVIG